METLLVDFHIHPLIHPACFIAHPVHVRGEPTVPGSTGHKAADALKEVPVNHSEIYPVTENISITPRDIQNFAHIYI